MFPCESIQKFLIRLFKVKIMNFCLQHNSASDKIIRPHPTFLKVEVDLYHEETVLRMEQSGILIYRYIDSRTIKRESISRLSNFYFVFLCQIDYSNIKNYFFLIKILKIVCDFFYFNFNKNRLSHYDNLLPKYILFNIRIWFLNQNLIRLL